MLADAPDELRAALSHCSIIGMNAAMDDEFYRIRRLPPYVFAEVNAMKAAARARRDIVDPGHGQSDARAARRMS